MTFRFQAIVAPLKSAMPFSLLPAPLFPSMEANTVELGASLKVR